MKAAFNLIRVQEKGNSCIHVAGEVSRAGSSET
jgi:hypothetical protein